MHDSDKFWYIFTRKKIMTTLKPYLHHYSLTEGCKISFFETNLETHRVKGTDKYKFEIDLKSTAIFMTCFFLGKGCIDGQETLGFSIIESGVSK